MSEAVALDGTNAGVPAHQGTGASVGLAADAEDDAMRRHLAPHGRTRSALGPPASEELTPLTKRPPPRRLG